MAESDEDGESEQAPGEAVREMIEGLFTDGTRDGPATRAEVWEQQRCLQKEIRQIEDALEEGDRSSIYNRRTAERALANSGAAIAMASAIAVFLIAESGGFYAPWNFIAAGIAAWLAWRTATSDLPDRPL